MPTETGALKTPLDTRQSWQAPEDGRLDACVRARLDCSHGVARKAVRGGKVSVGGQVETDIGLPVAQGAQLDYVPNAPRQRAGAPRLALLHVDPQLIVVDKPAGVLSSPIDDGPPDLTVLLARQLKSRPPKVVHRLDRDTSGLVVLARTVEAARRLREALDEHDVERQYHCVVRGRPARPEAMVHSRILLDAGGGKRGSAPGSLQLSAYDAPDPEEPEGYGQHAITRYKVVASDADHSAVEVQLATGRTHQIRIHMSELGCPVLADRVYAVRIPVPRRQALHAASLSFQHPFTGEQMRFTSPWPEDLVNVTPRPPHW